MGRGDFFVQKKSTLAITRVLRPCTELALVSKFVHRTTIEIVGQFHFSYGILLILLFEF